LATIELHIVISRILVVRTGEQKSQIDLAKAAQTADATIRNRVKDLKNSLELNK